MPIRVESSPSAAKAWSPEVVASATGLAIAALDVLFVGEYFRVPSIDMSCTAPGSYRLVLCRGSEGASLALERDGRLPDGVEEVVYLARWTLRDGQTCADAEIEVTERTLVGDVPEDVEDFLVGSTVLVHTPTPSERIAAANATVAETIGAGFTFRGRRFSLSIPSQITIGNAYTIRATIPYPLRWADANDTGFVVMESAADIEAFYQAATLAVLVARSTGNAAKAEVLAEVAG